MKKILTVTAVLALSVSTFWSSAIASEGDEILNHSDSSSKVETTLSNEDFKKVEENLLSMGVDTKTTESLLATLKNGGVLEADILDFDQAQDLITKVDGDVTTTTYIYSDGSRAQAITEELEIEELPIVAKQIEGGISLQSITGGTCSSGTGYTICSGKYVSRQFSTYGFSFYASYQIVQGAYDKISSAGDWNTWSAGGTVSNPSMRIVKSTENISGPAEARLSGMINLANSAGTITRSLSLRVGSDKAVDAWNTFY